MIYLPIDIKSPIYTKRTVNIQKCVTNNIPEIIVELHDCCRYFDLGDDCTINAAITNTDLCSTPFTGSIVIKNPHRGQLVIRLNEKDFIMSGINTMTVMCTGIDFTISFQFTVFVQSMSQNLLYNL